MLENVKVLAVGSTTAQPAVRHRPPTAARRRAGAAALGRAHLRGDAGPRRCASSRRTAAEASSTWCCCRRPAARRARWPRLRRASKHDGVLRHGRRPAGRCGLRRRRRRARRERCGRGSRSSSPAPRSSRRWRTWCSSSTRRDRSWRSSVPASPARSASSTCTASPSSHRELGVVFAVVRAVDRRAPAGAARRCARCGRDRRRGEPPPVGRPRGRAPRRRGDRRGRRRRRRVPVSPVA